MTLLSVEFNFAKWPIFLAAKYLESKNISWKIAHVSLYKITFQMEIGFFPFKNKKQILDGTATACFGSIDGEGEMDIDDTSDLLLLVKDDISLLDRYKILKKIDKDYDAEKNFGETISFTKSGTIDILSNVQACKKNLVDYLVNAAINSRSPTQPLQEEP